MLPAALTIAGSDPSGGAGIQADLKTFHQFGVYGQAVLTLLTVQNTVEVARVELVGPELVAQQIRAVIEDIPPAAAKTGALGSVSNVETVADLAAGFTFPLVLDPVMISKHGNRLLSDQAVASLRRTLLPRADLVTPNIPEAEALTGRSIETLSDMESAALLLLETGARAVLIKGGHRQGEPLDVLVQRNGNRLILPGRRVESRHTHGTGCTYSAAITAGLALGRELEDAVRQAKRFIQSAIESAPGLGRGHGPVNHFAKLESMTESTGTKS